MFVVGLTGGIGSGKSTAGNYFKSLGINVVDADNVARHAVTKSSDALQQIVAHFGNQILLANGELDRAKLRKIIFNDSEQKYWLESLLHPIIRKKTSEALDATTSEYAILESPLLFEMGQDQFVDRVAVVDVPEELQVKRAASRDSNSETQIKAIMKSQISREERLERAEDILDNSQTPNFLESQIKILHKTYLKLARATLG